MEFCCCCVVYCVIIKLVSTFRARQGQVMNSLKPAMLRLSSFETEQRYIDFFLFDDDNEDSPKIKLYV